MQKSRRRRTPADGGRQTEAGRRAVHQGQPHVQVAVQRREPRRPSRMGVGLVGIRKFALPRAMVRARRVHVRIVAGWAWDAPKLRKYRAQTPLRPHSYL